MNRYHTGLAWWRLLDRLRVWWSRRNDPMHQHAKRVGLSPNLYMAQVAARMGRTTMDLERAGFRPVACECGGDHDGRPCVGWRLRLVA
jgi:hypothetical protein